MVVRQRILLYGLLLITPPLVAGGYLPSHHSVISGIGNLSLHKPIFNVAVDQNLYQHPIDGDYDLIQ